LRRSQVRQVDCDDRDRNGNEAQEKEDPDHWIATLA
jgi:hypothetical protein